jgi:hypothetical protein
LAVLGLRSVSPETRGEKISALRSLTRRRCRPDNPFCVVVNSQLWFLCFSDSQLGFEVNLRSPDDVVDEVNICVRGYLGILYQVGLIRSNEILAMLAYLQDHERGNV